MLTRSLPRRRPSRRDQPPQEPRSTVWPRTAHRMYAERRRRSRYRQHHATKLSAQEMPCRRLYLRPRIPSMLPSRAGAGWVRDRIPAAGPNPGSSVVPDGTATTETTTQGIGAQPPPPWKGGATFGRPCRGSKTKDNSTPHIPPKPPAKSVTHPPMPGAVSIRADFYYNLKLDLVESGRKARKEQRNQ